MTGYDGSIRINTKINVKNAQIQLSALENRMVKTADKISSLRSKMDALKDQKIPTGGYKTLQEELKQAYSSLDSLLAKQKELKDMGFGEKDIPKSLTDEIDKAGLKVGELEEKVSKLNEEGKAFTLGKDTEEYVKLGQQLKYAENEMETLNQKHEVQRLKVKKAESEYKKLGNTAKKSFGKINKSTKKTGGLLGTMASRFKGLALSLLIFNQISKAFNAMTSGIKEGFDNFYKGNESFKNSIDRLKASLLTLKNSFATAFAPLVQAVIPYIQKAVEWMTALINKIGQFIAAVSGQKTYTKAINQTASAIKEQNKAQNKQLSSLDKLNNLTSENGDKEDGGAADMFEEVPIDKGVLDFLQNIKDFLKPIIDYAQKLKDIFAQGFWDGLGDWEYRWESIKASIASIKGSLINIWTDQAVLAATDKLVQSVAYVFGSLVGSMASIGLTIATNLVGGIAKYLEQNKDRIKQHLISMFDIWSEINTMFAELFQSIAYVFEAFASEQGQQLTSNLIGIFADAFMEIQKLSWKFTRDIVKIIIQPFVDNKEGFRTALEGFLGVLSTVTGTIKQGIDDTFAKLNEVYDAHFKPLFDSIAIGLSSITGKFLDFWNTNVQPMLSTMAKDFDNLWKEHIQPMFNKVANYFGKFADLIKVLWKNWIQPLVEWIIENVLPKILPVLKTLWNGANTTIGNISDAIGGIIDAMSGYIDFLTGVFSGDWKKAWGGIKTFFNGIWTAIINIVKTAINVVKTVILTGVSKIKANWDIAWTAIRTIASNAWKGIKGIFSGIGGWFKGKFDGAVKNIKSAFSGVAGFFGDVWSGIKSAFGNIVEWFRGKFSKAWEAVKKVFSTGGKVFDGIKDGILNGLKAVINGLIGGINKVIKVPFDGLNTALKKIKDIKIVGKKPFGFLQTIDVPEIPKLATGAVIPPNKEFLAVLGDQKHGTNIEAPLSTIEEAVVNAIAKVSGSKGNAGNGNVTIEVPIYLDNRQIAKGVWQATSEEFYRSGGNLPFPI